MTYKKLPDFFLLGFQKSGTSSLYSILNQFDVISLPYLKETHYFSNDKIYLHGIKWYLKQFNVSTNSLIKGEIDPSYILNKTSLNRIKENYKEFPKFIFIMRKPIERAYSHYKMSKYRGYENLSFKEALDNEQNRLLRDKTDFSYLNYSYMKRSEYFTCLNDFINIFPNNQVLYLNFNDLISEKSCFKMIENIFKFLNINISNINFNYIHNNPASIYKNKTLRNFLYKDSVLKNLLKLLIPNKFIPKLKIKIDNLNKKTNLNYLKERDIDLCLPDKYFKWNNIETKKIEQLTNLNLKSWYIK